MNTGNDEYVSTSSGEEQSHDEQNNLVGSEILRISERVPAASLKSVLIESA